MSTTQGDLPLERVCRWERERPERLFLTQPIGGRRTRSWTWSQAIGEARRIAAYLRAQNWGPGSRIAILSKNSAWWIMSDLAIWMAGHVSVPVYPLLRAQSIRQILEHSGARACFLGATDEKMTSLSLDGISWIVLPNAGNSAVAPYGPGWEELLRSNAPIAGSPSRPADDLETIIYTSGTTGTPKGVMHRFLSLAFNAKILADRLHLSGEQRVLSYLPLAHIVERAGVEASALIYGWHLFFTEGIETFVADLQRARPTLFLSVPQLLFKFQQGVYAKVSKSKLDRLLRIPGLA